MRIITILIGIFFGISVGSAEEQLWIEAAINGKPVRMVFDTGATEFVLTESAAQRLGLKMDKSGADERVGSVDVIVTGTTEKCLQPIS